jgi:hypothetical protein
MTPLHSSYSAADFTMKRFVSKRYLLPDGLRDFVAAAALIVTFMLFNPAGYPYLSAVHVTSKPPSLPVQLWREAEHP